MSPSDALSRRPRHLAACWVNTRVSGRVPSQQSDKSRVRVSGHEAVKPAAPTHRLGTGNK